MSNAKKETIPRDKWSKSIPEPIHGDIKLNTIDLITTSVLIIPKKISLSQFSYFTKPRDIMSPNANEHKVQDKIEEDNDSSASKEPSDSDSLEQF